MVVMVVVVVVMVGWLAYPARSMEGPRSVSWNSGAPVMQVTEVSSVHLPGGRGLARISQQSKIQVQRHRGPRRARAAGRWWEVCAGRNLMR